MEELRGVLAAHPSLQEISFVGHSMGGLIARYAAGQLFDPETRLIADRLRPVHYVSLATPHLGCDLLPGICEVPLVSWLCAPPVVGRAIGFVVRPFVSGVVCRHLRRSGRQFFLTDGDGGAAPLIERLARDGDARGGRYLAALAAFETRTLYANVLAPPSHPLVPELGVCVRRVLPRGQVPATLVQIALDEAAFHDQLPDLNERLLSLGLVGVYEDRLRLDYSAALQVS